MEWQDQIEHGGYTYPVTVDVEWEESEASCYPGYWDIRCTHRITGEDMSPYLSYADLRRMERQARQIAEASWNDAAPDPAY